MDPQTIEQLEKMFDRKLEGVNNYLQDMNSKMDNNMILIQNTIGSLVEEVNTIKKEQTNQNAQFEKLKEKERDFNLIFHGIKKPNYRESLDEIIQILEESGLTGSKYLIKGIVKLGSGNWGDKPIMVSLTSSIFKIDILKNRKCIEEQFEGVKIKEDHSEEIRKVRKELSVYSKLAVDNKIKVHMKKDKLIIHGKAWTLNALENDTNKTFLREPKRKREDEMEISPNNQSQKKNPSTQNLQSKKNNIEDYFQVSSNAPKA